MKTFIHEHINDETLNVERLELWSNMSKNQFYRKVKATTGMSSVQFINHIRIQYAAGLLRDSELNIREVAYASGFKDPNYFTRAFKRLFNTSPSDYKELNGL